MRATRRRRDSRPRLRFLDLLSDGVASLSVRPERAALTLLGTVIGIAALVATLGLSQTADSQIVGRFDELAATDVVVASKTGRTGVATASLPWDSVARALRLNGVSAAGTLSDVDLRGQLVRAVPLNDPQGQTQFQLAVRATLATGRVPDAGHSARADRVAVLGRTSPSAFTSTGSTTNRRSSSASASTSSSESSPMCKGSVAAQRDHHPGRHGAP